MSLTTEPCEKHELTNCSICTGKDRKFRASLEEPQYDRGALPKIPGGATIFANYPSTCAGCGRRYPKGEPIHHSQDHDGWVGVSCCA